MMNVSKSFIVMILICPIIIFAQNSKDTIVTKIADSLSKSTTKSVTSPDSVILKNDSSASFKIIDNKSIALKDSTDTAKKTGTIVEETEEQLILDGGEESLIPTAAENSSPLLLHRTHLRIPLPYPRLSTNPILSMTLHQLPPYNNMFHRYSYLKKNRYQCMLKKCNQ